MNLLRPGFHDSFLGGYNKSDVDKYVSGVQAQVKQFNAEQEAKDKLVEQLRRKLTLAVSGLKSKDAQLQQMQQALAQANAKLDAAAKENSALAAHNQAFLRTAGDLSNQLDLFDSKVRKLQQAYSQLKQTGTTDPAMQEALGDARLMASQIRAQAQQELDAKRLEASAVIAEAENRKNELQKEYDRILMDASSFKAELMDMYRRHLSLLASFPEPEGRLSSYQPVYLEQDMAHIPEDSAEAEAE